MVQVYPSEFVPLAPTCCMHFPDQHELNFPLQAAFGSFIAVGTLSFSWLGRASGRLTGCGPWSRGDIAT